MTEGHFNILKQTQLYLETFLSSLFICCRIFDDYWWWNEKGEHWRRARRQKLVLVLSLGPENSISVSLALPSTVVLSFSLLFHCISFFLFAFCSLSEIFPTAIQTPYKQSSRKFNQISIWQTNEWCFVREHLVQTPYVVYLIELFTFHSFFSTSSCTGTYPFLLVVVVVVLCPVTTEISRNASPSSKIFNCTLSNDTFLLF